MTDADDLMTPLPAASKSRYSGSSNAFQTSATAFTCSLKRLNDNEQSTNHRCHSLSKVPSVTVRP
jgi:hypothetical protein